MAIERNFTGFEFADVGELRYGSGAVSGALTSIPSGTARSGNYHLRAATAAASANLLSFPAGTIVGTTGTVTAGNHKRVSVRAYFRLESTFNSGQIRIAGFGDDNGTCTVWFGNENTAGGFLQAGNFIGLRVGSQTFNHNPGVSVPFGTQSLSTGVWYRLLLDLDILVDAVNSVLTASVRVTEDSDAPTVDFTVSTSASLAANVDNIDKFALGYSSTTVGSFNRTIVANWDDVVYIATSDTDAASGQPTLPTQTHIYAIIPPTGHAVRSAGWTGTFADVDEYPVSGSDTMSSSTAGNEVEFTHATGIALGYQSITAMKLYVNALISGAGTGSVDYMLNGVAKNVTLGVNYPANIAVDPSGGVTFTTLTAKQFAATTFGIKKQNGTQATVLANIGLEVIGTLAAYGSGDQIRGETQIKAGSIYDAQIADAASIQRHKIQGLGDGSLPILFSDEGAQSDDWMIPGPPGSAASVRIPVVPVFFPDDAEDAMLMAASSSSSSGGGGTTTTNNTYLGSQVLLAELTASASSSLDFTTRNVAGQSGALFQTDYDEYLVEYISALPTTAAVNLVAQLSTDGGATWLATAYKYAGQFTGSNSSTGTIGSEVATSIMVAGSLGNDAGEGASGSLVLTGLLTAVNKKALSYSAFKSSDTHWYSMRVGSFLINTGTMNALRMIMSSGTIASGTIRVYGITKQAQSIQNAPAHGLVLVAQASASASASLDLTARNVGSLSGALFQSDYDEYLVEFVNFLPVTNAVGIQVRFSTDGGATWAQGASDYRWSFMAYGSGGPGNTSSTGATSISVIGFANISNSVLRPTSGFMRVFNPLSTTAYKMIASHQAYWDSTPTLVTGELVGAYQSATAVNAIQFFASSGNIASGTIRVYGIVKDATYPVSTIQTGTHASRPAAGNAGRIYLPNDGFSVGRDSGTSWETFGPIYPLANPPTGVWTWRNQGTSTISETKDALILVGSASGAVVNIVARVKTIIASPYTITAYVLPPVQTKLFNGYGITLRQNGAGTGTGRLVTFWWCLGNSAGADAGGIIRIEKWSSETAFSASYFEVRAITQPRWFRIVDDGTNLKFSVSADGQTWIQIFSVLRLDYMLQGADQAGPFVMTHNNAAPNLDVPLTLLSWKEA